MKYKIPVNSIEQSKLPKVDINNVPFGRFYSDHMFCADYVDGEWKDFRIVPFGKITMSPANLTLHYGQSVFEGMKASKNEKGNPMLFRLDRHISRLNNSAKRMGMPEFPEDLFFQALHQLVGLDRNWVPDSPNALYIRPFMFAADEFIGVRSSDTYRFIIFTGPVASYYKDPVKLLTAENSIRAAKGGVGAAKTAGNYARTLQPMNEASKKGFDQIMWMSADFKYIQECGTMNLFFIIDGTIITPPTTDGTILEGITRDSFITILENNNYKVEIRPLSIDEVIEAYHNGKLEDVFGSGTAAVVAPVSEITYKDLVMKIPLEGRKISEFLKDELNNIRSGKSQDKYGWIQEVSIENTLEEAI